MKEYSPDSGSMNWTILSQLVIFGHKGSKVLAINVDPLTLMATAVESIKKKSAKTDLQKANIVFNNHAHKVIGQFDTLTAAMSATEAFMYDWKLGISIQKCSCGEIS